MIRREAAAAVAGARCGGLAGRALAVAFIALVTLAARTSGAAPAHGTPTLTRAQADSLATLAPSSARDRALSEWAKHASATDLGWILRRAPAELRGSEALLLDAALACVPATRGELRQRLLARRSLATVRPLKRGEPPPLDLSALRPYASVFRVAALFPDAGEYAAYDRALVAALAHGLAWGRVDAAPAIALDTLGTGDSDPVRTAAALEQVASHADVVVGELLSVPTLSLATATRLAGLVLVSPTATDERIGRVGPRVFQVGPGGEARARALAELVLGDTPRRLAVAGSAAGIHSALAVAFVREAEDRGGKLVRRDVAPSTASEAALLAGSLQASGADVLLWDGPGRDAETLVRALAAAGASLRVCGGPALAPEGMRPAVRPLLEGVAWVDDEWQLPPMTRVRLDSLATASGLRPGALWTRGFLAGQRIAAAVDAGALTAGEVAAHWRMPRDTSGAGGFLDVSPEGATLVVHVVRHGKAVDARERHEE